MSRRSVLVLGAGGMLGHKVVQTLAADAALEVHAASRRAVPPGFIPAGVASSTGVDLSAGSRPLRVLLERVRPDVIVNAIGAIKQKDLAATIDETFFLNASLPHLLPLLNPNPNGRVIHISTDCVFDGAKGAYREDDGPDAVDVYGRSKAVGEIGYGPHVTLRTSIIGFEITGHLGLLSWFLKQSPGSAVRGFTKAIFSGLPTVTLSRVIRDTITRHGDLSGLYHVASDPISKYALLGRVNEALDLGCRLEPDDRVKIDRSLDDTRFRQATGTIRPDWEALVDELRNDYLSAPYEPIYQELRGSVRAGSRS
jgi:dTDP-4-dehydrorhamnose reductase